MQNNSKIKIKFTENFKQQIRDLAKRYRHIKSDIEPIIQQLLKGNLVGDQIPKVGYTVFKVRIKNSDIQKEKIRQFYHQNM